MKRVLALILVLTLLVFAGTLVSADGKPALLKANSNLDKSIEQTEANRWHTMKNKQEEAEL